MFPLLCWFDLLLRTRFTDLGTVHNIYRYCATRTVYQTDVISELHHHHFSRKTSTAGHGPPPSVATDWFRASRIQRIPVILIRMSVPLAGELPTLRVPVRVRHSRTFRPRRSYICESCEQCAPPTAT